MDTTNTILVVVAVVVVIIVIYHYMYNSAYYLDKVNVHDKTYNATKPGVNPTDCLGGVNWVFLNDKNLQTKYKAQLFNADNTVKPKTTADWETFYKTNASAYDINTALMAINKESATKCPSAMYRLY